MHINALSYMVSYDLSRYHNYMTVLRYSFFIECTNPNSQATRYEKITRVITFQLLFHWHLSRSIGNDLLDIQSVSLVHLAVRDLHINNRCNIWSSKKWYINKEYMLIGYFLKILLLVEMWTTIVSSIWGNIELVLISIMMMCGINEIQDCH